MTAPARIVVLDATGAELGHVADAPRNGAPSWRIVCAECGPGRTVGFPDSAAYSLVAHLSDHGSAS